MSETPIDPVRELLEEYALGLLDDTERATVAARLLADPALRDELAAVREALTELGLASEVEGSTALKERVMAKIASTVIDSRDNTRSLLPRRSNAPIWLGAALAASLALIARLSIELRELRHDRAVQAAAIDSSHALLAGRDALISQLVDPGTAMVNLAATGDANPVVRAYVNRGRRSMVLSANALTPLAPGRTYQLWFIVNSKPVPSVTFKADTNGRVLIDNLALPQGAAATAAITNEPDGGSMAPTTKPIFVGKLPTE